jgi:hypothetical protein
MSAEEYKFYGLGTPNIYGERYAKMQTTRARVFSSYGVACVPLNTACT